MNNLFLMTAAAGAQQGGSVLAVILVCAVVTFLTRAIPFLIFGNRELPGVVQYLGDALPPAIMVILVLYFLKDTQFTVAPYGVKEVLACIFVILIHARKKNMYLSVISGTLLYMLLLHI
ncbi:MAG: AzlD domain-containing protein [Lachnospiraceae bacterium]|nr:AzlD domain-containing protein [Lachnospiraceae bacterium]